jgi:4-amino-4-deoxy-L-arabinose transferase-like glycosyltransferase
VAIVIWLCALTGVLILHFAHLAADFPNGSQWNDWSKYTDEGWYANAAIRQHLFGSWYLPGDFNPAVVLPVWPLLVSALFHFTGVSLIALRTLTGAIFLCDLLLVWLLVRWQTKNTVLSLLSVTLASSSVFLYAFNRLAILEPLEIAFALTAWLLALGAAGARRGVSRFTLAVALGVIVGLLILVKTTGVFLLPAVAWLLWYPQRRARKQSLLLLVTAGVTTALFWCGYYVGLVRPRFAADFHYFFEANTWAQPAGLRGWVFDAWSALHALFWTGRILPSLAIVVLLLSLGPLRRLWRLPLYPASWLGVTGCLFFVWWHNNPQPRYYTVVAYLLILVVTLGIAELWRRRTVMSQIGGSVALALASVAVVTGAFHIVVAARHAQYSYLQAAQALTRYIDTHPGGKRLLLSISGDQVSLMTKLPAITDDFGVIGLPERIALYQPGWFGAWNTVDAGTLEDIHKSHHLVHVADFPALDDPDRNVLLLYRILPGAGPDEGVVLDR